MTTRKTRSARTPRRGDDSGISLIELMIGMLLMVIFGGLFTSAVVMMNRTATKAESVTVSNAQLNNAFLKLDKLVRYASAISTPAITTNSTGDWYVELESKYTGSTNCTQIRIDKSTSQLQQRSWAGSGANPTVSSWSSLGNNITNGTATSGSTYQPFNLIAQTASAPFQKLTLNLVATAGNSNPTTSYSSLTFTAVNTNVLTTTNVCTNVSRP